MESKIAHPQPPAARTKPTQSGGKRSRGKRRRPRDWQAGRESYLRRMTERAVERGWTASGEAVIAPLGPMRMAWSVMWDQTGAEGEWHLGRFTDDVWIGRVLEAASGGINPRTGRPYRTWVDRKFRAIVAIALFCAYVGRPGEHRGRPVLHISGFPMGFFQVLTSQLTAGIGDGNGETLSQAARNTIGHVARKKGNAGSQHFHGWMGELLRVGVFTEGHQYKAASVAPHLKGRIRRNKRTGAIEQWAFIQLYMRPLSVPVLNMKPEGNRARVRRLGLTLSERIERQRAMRAQAQRDGEAEPDDDGTELGLGLDVLGELDPDVRAQLARYGLRAASSAPERAPP